jgi:ADP-ribose pyrophosphatase
MSDPLSASNTEKPGLIESREILRGRVITVATETVRFPDGSTGVLDVVHHPGASAVLPVLGAMDSEDPAILLIRQYRHAAGTWLLEVPAGRLDAGESPDACAHRELREETGCTATGMLPLTTILTTPGFSDERIHLFIATGLSRGETKREADEFIEPVTLLLSDALEKVRVGEITDAKTVISLLYAAGYKLGR